MPIYSYICPGCRIEYERITLLVSKPPDSRCEGCGEPGRMQFGVPMVKTNTAFFRDAKYGGGQFEGEGEEVIDTYTGPAKAAGVSITGKTYMHGLARYPGDPEAWVDDIHSVKKTLAERGWGSEQLGLKARQVEPERIALGEDLVDVQLDQMIAAGKIDPHDREKNRDAAREMATPKYKPGRGKRPTFTIPV